MLRFSLVKITDFIRLILTIEESVLHNLSWRQ